MVVSFMKSRLVITSGYFNITRSISNWLMHLTCGLLAFFFCSLSLALLKEETFVLYRNVAFDINLPYLLTSIKHTSAHQSLQYIYIHICTNNQYQLIFKHFALIELQKKINPPPEIYSYNLLDFLEEHDVYGGKMVE